MTEGCLLSLNKSELETRFEKNFQKGLKKNSEGAEKKIADSEEPFLLLCRSFSFLLPEETLFLPKG